MKTSNKVDGKFFAELHRDVTYPRVANQKNKVAIEPRLSIYGRKSTEWHSLSDWFVKHKVASVDPDTGCSTNRVRYMIQIPRLCKIFMGKSYKNFQEVMMNIFQPLFDATLAPGEHPNLHVFLAQIGAFDCVDDESNLDPLLHSDPPTNAADMQEKTDTYSYWAYHLYANLRSLNFLRAARGLNTFEFKPHCGEAGPIHHLASAFLTADSINHGIRLEKNFTMQYVSHSVYIMYRHIHRHTATDTQTHTGVRAHAHTYSHSCVVHQLINRSTDHFSKWSNVLSDCRCAWILRSHFSLHSTPLHSTPLHSTPPSLL